MKLKLKIHGKLLFSVLGFALVIYVVALGYLLLEIRSSAEESATKLTNATAAGLAAQTQAELTSHINIARSLKHTLYKYPEMDDQVRDEAFKPILKELLLNNPSFIAVWYNWELQAINKNYKKNHGRVRSVYYRQGGRLGTRVDTLNLRSDSVASTYYSLKLNPRELITDPYTDNYTADPANDTRMTSVVVPIMINQKFAGLVGIDIALDKFQDYTNRTKPYKNTRAYLVSNSGVLVALNDTKFLNKPIDAIFPPNNTTEILKEKIKKGEQFSFFSEENKNKTYTIFQPLVIGNSQTPWSIGMVVPVNEIMKDVRKSFYFSLVVSLLGLLLMIIVVTRISRKLTGPIKRTTAVIQGLTKGDISESKKMPIRSFDEISEIRKSVNSLIDSLNTTAQFADEIGKGNLESVYKPLSDNDLLGNSLLQMRKSLKLAAEEDRKRKAADALTNWATTGAAKFADILRKNTDNLNEFAYSIISSLSKYIDVNQGGVFLINDNDENNKFIELAASYAFDRRKMLKKRISLGVGLVGRCILEKETIYMTNLPQEYINITSGMGEENPSQLLLVPLQVNDVIFGAIELASFKPIEQHVIDFVELIGESIASTIATVKINIKTAQLLEDTKLKSEEMASQEEEIRQNMEEMQSSQEELKANVEVLTDDMNAIKSVSLLVEYDLDGRITDITDRFLRLLGKTKEDVVGKFQGSFSTIPQDIDYFNSFWDQLRAGVIKSYEQTIIVNGKEQLIAGKYVPVKDADGFTYKVISVSYLKSEL